MFEKLFSPIKIKDMELKNRIILPAMGERNFQVTEVKLQTN